MPENAPQPAPEKKPTCFIIMPLTVPTERLDDYGGDCEHFHHVLEYLFVPAVEAAGFVAQRPIAKGAELIHAEIIRQLNTADLVLCDMSIRNPNVFFELGVRTALNKPVCMIRDRKTSNVPFDVATINYHIYNEDLRQWVLEKELPKLTEHLREATQRSGGKNPMWQTFGIASQANFDVAGPKSTDDMLRLLAAGMEDLRGRIGRPPFDWYDPSLYPTPGSLAAAATSSDWVVQQHPMETHIISEIRSLGIQNFLHSVQIRGKQIQVTFRNDAPALHVVTRHLRTRFPEFEVNVGVTN